MRLAAVLYESGGGAETDALLYALTLRVRRRGLRLAGAVQSNPTAAGRSRCDILLEDLATGRQVMASDDRGRLARGCRLDTGALEECVGLSLSALDKETDLVVVNRFGKRETEGHGFRQLIEEAVLLGVPALVGLNRAHLDSWQVFVGEEPVLLPPKPEAVARWCAANVAGLQRDDEACDGEMLTLA